MGNNLTEVADSHERLYLSKNHSIRDDIEGRVHKHLVSDCLVVSGCIRGGAVLSVGLQVE